ncbi:MAG: SPASM domain-containing protein, partial [Xanthobacteraceae bacterium]
ELFYNWRIGSLRDRAFKDIWFGPEAMAVRRKVIDDTAICPACDHYRFCLNGSSVDMMTAAAYVTTQRAQSEQIILLDQVGDYNLVTWRHQFFALNRSLGNVDVERYDVRRLPGTFIASSRRAIVAAAEQRQRRGPLQRKAEKAAASVAGVALRKSEWLRDRLQRQ